MKISDLIPTARLFEHSVAVYHGSQNRGPTFTMGHTGHNSHTLGSYDSTRWGVFFTDNPDFARLYGEVEEYRVDLDHTLDFDRDRGETIHDFAESLDPFDPAERGLWIDARNVIQGRWPIWQLFENAVGERFVRFLKERGFDSGTFTETNEDDEGVEHESKTLVVLDTTRIRRVSP